MKKLLMLMTFGLLAVSRTGGQTNVSQTFAGGQIPAGPVGAVFGGVFNSAPANNQVTGLTVDLNVTGGVAGGFYAYLIAPGGAEALLLDQPGVTAGDPFGNLGSGLDLRLADGGTAMTASSDLNLGTGSPYSAPDSLSLFGTPATPGSPANGTWELFFANLADNGGAAPTLNGWSLNVTTVPEPGALALGGVALLLLAGARFRRFSRSPR